MANSVLAFVLATTGNVWSKNQSMANCVFVFVLATTDKVAGSYVQGKVLSRKASRKQTTPTPP